MATATTIPTGLKITRDGNIFTFSWKIASGGYGDGQQLQYRILDSKGWSKWTDASITDSQTSKTITISANHYHPVVNGFYLREVQFQVRGNRKNEKKKSYSWSAWAQKSFDVLHPNKAAITVTPGPESNVCKFSWNVEVSTSSAKWFKNVRIQSMLVKNDGSKLKWNSSKTGWIEDTGSASGNKTITENSALIATGSYTRWFRVVSRGPQGPSKWVYAKHVYAQPNQAKVNKIESGKDSSGGISINVKWTAPATAANPIDNTTVQYKIAVPDVNLACPSSGSWTEVDVSRDTKGKDAVHFVCDDNLNADECLWCRVNTEHSGDITYGKPTLTKIGYLKNPSNLSVTQNAQTFRATVTATNESDVPDSFLAVVFRRSGSPDDDYVVGIIPHGESSVTVQCPDWSEETAISFGVYACVGAYTKQEREDDTDCYAVTPKMKSKSTLWSGGNVPQSPDEVTLARTDTEGTIRVTWDWAWRDANAAELSWADHADAWESTDAPETFIISNLFASAWNISGLDMGKTWYVRVRLINGDTYGPYSEMAEINLTSAPIRPDLVLSQPAVVTDGVFTAYWDYVSSDTTDQSYAEIREVTIENDEVVLGDAIAHVQTAQHVDIERPASWVSGQTYLLCVQVTSASGSQSEWSYPVAIVAAEPVDISITSSSIELIQIDLDDGSTREVLALTEMPLSLTVGGVPEDGTTTVIIERASDYRVARPDESTFHGYEGETIAIISQEAGSSFEIDNGNLIGHLDDGAPYRLLVAAQDAIGQTDVAYLDFEVHWEHQAIMPEARELLHGSIIEITPIAPTGAGENDTCDIYRLSADKPVLIVQDAEFGTTYVDPYPAMGETGGHRVVYKTENGDYITAGDVIAWLDMQDEYDEACTIIDFDGDQVMLQYNLTLANAWKKELTKTKYLGGSVQGDWGQAVNRTTTVKGVTITDDEDTVASLRRLAEYPGICHVRTPDGGSFCADVQVTENRSYQSGGRKVEFSLTITRLDPVGLDGMTLAVWEDR